MPLENAPCVECMDKGLCFLLKHSSIIATVYWILLLKPSFVISQGQPCWHTFHALMSPKNKRPIKCVKPTLTPLYFDSSHAWYAWLVYYKIQQLFIECVIMHECNNNFAFPSHSSIYTAILNIHCFFFPLVYKYIVTSFYSPFKGQWNKMQTRSNISVILTITTKCKYFDVGKYKNIFKYLYSMTWLFGIQKHWTITFKVPHPSGLICLYFLISSFFSYI